MYIIYNTIFILEMKKIYILIGILLLILVLSSLRITEGFDNKNCPELSDIDKQINELNKQKDNTKKVCVEKIMLKNGIINVLCNPEKYGLTKNDILISFNVNPYDTKTHNELKIINYIDGVCNDKNK